MISAKSARNRGIPARLCRPAARQISSRDSSRSSSRRIRFITSFESSLSLRIRKRASHHDADLAKAALVMAVAVRGGTDAIAGVIMHTDQGSEYTAGTFREACGPLGITQSMGRVGSALDNAVIESWHSTVEFELRQLERFATKASTLPGDCRRRQPSRFSRR
jgi:transposase InsO family protein